jgi:excisionase family DNA binding protein
MEPKPRITTRKWPDIKPGTYRVEEAAKLLGIARSTVYQQINEGKIPSLKFGRARRIPCAVIDRMLAADASS